MEQDGMIRSLQLPDAHSHFFSPKSQSFLPFSTATMFAPPSPKSLSLFFPNHTRPSTLLLYPQSTFLSKPSPKLPKPISASHLPTPPPPSSSSSSSHPPQSPSSSDLLLQILRKRHGLWHQYAPHISTLYQDFSFFASDIEDSTGISCVDQVRLLAAAQVRDSLLASQVRPEVLAFFDASPTGPHLLYELRHLNAPQLAAAALHLEAQRVDDPSAARELALAMEGRAESPGDCLAFMHVHRSRKLSDAAKRMAALQRALEVAETESVKQWVSKFCKAHAAANAELPIVSMKAEDVVESTVVVRMPACSAEEGELGVASAPYHRMVGEFGILTAEKPLGKWAVLRGWEQLLKIEKGGIVVRFKDGGVLPWKLGGVFYMEEEILVVVNREKKAVVEEEGFYLVGNSQHEHEHGGLRVEKGGRLQDKGVKDSLGLVALVVRLPANKHNLQFLEDTPMPNAVDNNAPQVQIPTIDLNGVDGDRRRKIVAEIRRASETWGSFQLVNHGIPVGILDNAIESIRGFHEQPEEAKLGFSTDGTGDRRQPRFADDSKFRSSLYRSHQLRLGDLRDSLICVFHADPPPPEEVPEICRDAVLEYEKHLFKLGETVFGLISEALGLRTTYLQDLGCLEPLLMACHYYRPCPLPRMNYLPEHTDNVFLGMVVQDHIGGLQVRHRQHLVDVEPIRGSLLVVVGGLLQVQAPPLASSIAYVLVWELCKSGVPAHDVQFENMGEAYPRALLMALSFALFMLLQLLLCPCLYLFELKPRGMIQYPLATNGKFKAGVHKVVEKRQDTRVSIITLFHHRSPEFNYRGLRGLISGVRPANGNAEAIFRIQKKTFTASSPIRGKPPLVRQSNGSGQT
ncbi:hypothetical protein ACLOJK_015429 [Asimina triloba]